jgi:heme/copper-type cytochrome/quinol oxidase subunit 4
MSGVKCRIENEYQELLNEAIVQLVLQLLMFVCNRKSIEGWALQWTFCATLEV